MTDWQRYLLVALIIIVLIIVHELGHLLCAKAVKVPVRAFGIFFGPKLFGFQWGETEVRLNSFPAGGYCAFYDDEEDELPADSQQLLRNRPLWQRMLVLSGGVLFNYIFAFILLLAAALTIGFAEVKTGELEVTQLVQGGRAQGAGVAVGDALLAVDGTPVKDADHFIRLVRAHAAQPLTLTLRHAQATRDVAVTPNPQGKIGVGIQARFLSREFHHPANPLGAALQAQATMTQQNVDAMVQLFTGRMDVNQLGGIVEIGRAGAYVARHDVRDLVSFAALISIGLAVMNFLPLPALDGGHMVFRLLEAILRRPIPRKIEDPIQQGGLMVLLVIMALLLVKDLTRPIKYPELPSPAPSATVTPVR